VWRDGDARDRRRRAIEELDLLDDVRVGATPVADGETAARGCEQDEQHEELAACVERHEQTIPSGRPGG
jgi:hypothetical protein